MFAPAYVGRQRRAEGTSKVCLFLFPLRPRSGELLKHTRNPGLRIGFGLYPLRIRSSTHTTLYGCPHARTSVRGLRKTGLSPIKGLPFSPTPVQLRAAQAHPDDFFRVRNPQPFSPGCKGKTDQLQHRAESQSTPQAHRRRPGVTECSLQLAPYSHPLPEQ